MNNIRILWIGGGAPPTPLDAPPFAIDIENAPSWDEALAQLARDRWDATIADAAALPAPALASLSHLAATPNAGALIIQTPPATPPELISEWLAALGALRLLRDPAEPAALAALLTPPTPNSAAPPPTTDDASMRGELERLTRQATIDNLTGLLRREEMARRAGEEIDRARRTGQPLVCIMCDIDHFKRVNDLFGHATGDRALCAVARLLSTGRRSYDLAGRMGGEEFMLLIPGPPLEEGAAIAERLRRAIQDYPWSGESLPQLTLSFGVAELLHGSYPDLAALGAAADAALYEAKHRGRNQVCRVEDVRAAAPPEGGDRRTPHLLLVDDTPLFLGELCALLTPRYHIDATTSPLEALRWAAERAYDLVIADQHMPALSGHELLARLRALQPGAVRILMSSHADLASAIGAINQSEVFRYVLKPWHDEDMLLTVHLALEQRTLAGNLRDSDRETIMAMADSLELRDRGSRGHYQRVGELCLRLGGHLGYPEPRLRLLEYGAWLHDIGKIGIPDAILHKRTPLTRAEERLLREHPVQGARLVAAIEHLRPVAPFIRHHHEHYDGLGYPDGLRAAAIPEESRIIAIANAYDGLLTPRGDAPGLTPPEALARIQEGQGTLYDPELVKIFESLQNQE